MRNKSSCDEILERFEMLANNQKDNSILHSKQVHAEHHTLDDAADCPLDELLDGYNLEQQ